ncbi:MAG: ankyrin repeat domain-containing protein [Variovorax sp.]
MNLTLGRITLLRLARSAMFGFLYLFSAGASAELPKLDPLDLRLVKAVRSGDEAEVRAAIAAGGRIQGPEYEGVASPLFVAILFDRTTLIPLLAVEDSDVDMGYVAAIALGKPASFSSLQSIRAPSPKIVADGLRMFGQRFSSYVKASLRAGILELTGEPTDAPPPISYLLGAAPDHLASPEAPELDIARRLRGLGSGTGTFGDDGPISMALASGDVYFMDWLEAEGLVVLTEDTRAELFFSTVVNRFPDGFETMVKRGLRPSNDGAQGRDLLSYAAREGDGYFVTRLLELGAAINPPLDTGPSATPLNAAARGGHLSIARQLIDAGALPNIVGPDGTWALREAARRGHVELVKVLLSSGADARLTDAAGNTALHGFTSPTEEVDPYVLFGKVQRMLTDGHRESARMLLQAGLSAQAQNTDGVSILGSLLSGGRESADFWTELRLLGAEIDESCYMAVVNAWDVPHARLNWLFNAAGGDPNHVLRKPAGVSLVEFAASKSWLPTLESLFTLGARVPDDQAKQASMLGQILGYHHPGSLAAAFARGMSPDLKFSVNRTALESAISGRDVSIVRLFLDAGANVNMVSNSETQGNVLQELVQRDAARPGRILSSKQMPSVTLLIERGLDLAKRDKYGRTVFDLANKSPVTAKFLADAIAKAGSSTDAIHVAVRNGDLIALERLVESGSSIETSDSLGRTPLSVALATGQVAIARRLLRGGANIAAASTVPGIASDLSYATDPRFTSFFHPRLVADALIDVKTTPAEELAHLRTAATFRPGPMVWRIACRNGCKDETELKDSTSKPWDLSRSEREDSDGRTVVTAFIPFHTEDDVPGTDLLRPSSAASFARASGLSGAHGKSRAAHSASATRIAFPKLASKSQTCPAVRFS